MNEENDTTQTVDQFNVEVCECGKMIESCPDAYEHMSKGY